jgi:hypothetical protein
MAIAFRIEVWRHAVAYLRRVVGNPAAVLKVFCYFTLSGGARIQSRQAK